MAEFIANHEHIAERDNRNLERDFINYFIDNIQFRRPNNNNR